MNYYMKDIITTIKNQTELFDTRDKIKQLKIHNANWKRRNMLIEVKMIENGKECTDFMSLCSGETLDIYFNHSGVRIVSLKICGNSGQSITYVMVVDYFI